MLAGIIAISMLGYDGSSGSPTDPPIPCGAEQVVEQAKKDLARRKGIDKKDIAVVKAEAVEWPDTSLGCPEEGMMYAQVITPGYKIFLSYEEKIYEYHSDKEDRVVYCGGE